MATIRITCPHCGFSKDVDASKLSSGAHTIGCPRCKGRFDFIVETHSSAGIPVAGTDDGARKVAPVDEPRFDPRFPSSSRRGPGFSDRGGVPIADLSGPFELLTKAFNHYTARFSTLFGLQLIMSLVSGTVGLGLFGSIKATLKVSTILGLCLLLVGLVVIVAVNLFIVGAQYAAITDRSLGLGASLVAARRRYRHFSFIYGLLMPFYIWGGSFFFLIVGIVFAVWSCFAAFVLFDEGLTGTEAVFRSREYVEGYGLRIFFNLFVFVVLFASIFFGVTAIVATTAPFLSTLLQLLITPLFYVYLGEMYGEVKVLKGGAPRRLTAGDKRIQNAVAGIGFAVVMAMLVYGAASMGPNIKQFLPYLTGQKDGMKYFERIFPLEPRHGGQPSPNDNSKPDHANPAPADPGNGNGAPQQDDSGGPTREL